MKSVLEYSHTIGFLSNEGRGFNNPIDMCVGPNESIYILNRAGPEVGIRLPYKRVSVCSSDGEYIRQFGTGGTQAGEFWWPSSIDYTTSGEIVISDEALNRLSFFTPEGQFIRSFGDSGTSDGLLNRPSYVKCGSDGILYVSDSLNHRVQLFTLEGEYLDSRGGVGKLNFPWGLDLKDSDLFVCDWRDDSIKIWDTHGEVKAILDSARTGLYRPAHLLATQSGYYIVADWGNNRVVVLYDADPIQVLYGEAEASDWAKDYLRANPQEAEARRSANLLPSLYGKQASKGEPSANIESYFWGPTAIASNNSGDIFVVDSCRHRLQVYHEVNFSNIGSK